MQKISNHYMNNYPAKPDECDKVETIKIVLRNSIKRCAHNHCAHSHWQTDTGK